MEGGGEEADPRLCWEGTPTLWPLSTDEKGASVSKMQGAEGPRGGGGAGRGVGVGLRHSEVSFQGPSLGMFS